MFNFLGIENYINFSNTPPIRAIFCNTGALQVNAVSLSTLFPTQNNLIPIINPVEYDIVTSQITKQKTLIFPRVYNIVPLDETEFNAILLINSNNTFALMRLQTDLQTVSPTKPVRLKIPNLVLMYE